MTQIDEGEVEYNLSNLNTLTLEVTERCNINCVYCGFGNYYDDNEGRATRRMSFDQAKQAIDFLRKHLNSNKCRSYQRPFYIGFYGGEPLLEIELIKRIVEYAKGLELKNHRLAFAMTTNGILLRDHINFLANNKFSLLISLDGDAHSSGYRVHHNGSPTHSAVVENALYLKQRQPEYFETNVHFNAVLHNLNSVEGIHSFFSKEFGKRPMISELNTSGIKEELKKEFFLKYRNSKASLYESENYALIEDDLFIKSPTIKDLGIFLMQYLSNYYENYNGFFTSKIPKKYYPTGTCSPFSRKMYVTTQGEILICERIDYKYSVGRIDDAGVHIDIPRINRFYSEQYSRMKPLCEKCYNLTACVQCMFYLDLDKDRPMCSGFMSKTTFENYIAKQIDLMEAKPYLYKRIIEEVNYD
ncbi:radical SAM peptide maturase [Perlabentimonas gracilis]|uniref:radical SAM peptide maturase n=1 Tax=Perlabentimonas gracilis TaxID=2715279 RepID=UPI00140C6FA8|nr:radical SAM peptide maturase [Perlabentimonas gracilis]NHB70281.1 radical SAM peptide maturase [Perlabentimonas gracilis]